MLLIFVSEKAPWGVDTKIYIVLFSHYASSIKRHYSIIQRKRSHSILIPLQAQKSSNELSVRRWFETAKAGIEVLEVERNKSTVKNNATPPIVQPLVGR